MTMSQIYHFLEVANIPYRRAERGLEPPNLPPPDDLRGSPSFLRLLDGYSNLRGNIEGIIIGEGSLRNSLLAAVQVLIGSLYLL